MPKQLFLNLPTVNFSASQDPQDYGFMYNHSFQDPDGYLWEQS